MVEVIEADRVRLTRTGRSASDGRLLRKQHARCLVFLRKHAPNGCHRARRGRGGTRVGYKLSPAHARGPVCVWQTETPSQPALAPESSSAPRASSRAPWPARDANADTPESNCTSTDATA